MISTWHGHRVDMAAMPARFPLSLKGTNLAQLINYADRLKLYSRPIQLGYDIYRRDLAAVMQDDQLLSGSYAQIVDLTRES
jgi:ABC-type bacteriocin/lantibiotic exporter with double-glycine peptidase domain